jgi:hypothetical protein
MRTAAIIEPVPRQPAVEWDPYRGGASSAPSFSQNFTGPTEERRARASDLAANRGEALIRGARPRDHDEVDPVGEERRVLAKHLAHEALRAIARDRSAHLPGRDDPQTTRRRSDALGPIATAPLCHEEDEMVRGDSGATVLHAEEIAPLAEPAAPGIAETGRRPRGLHHATWRRASSPGACDPCGGGC